jgi:hypothetical protein
MTPKLRETVRQRAEKQRHYTSEHQYDLAQFNLSEAEIRRDCAFYYDTFMPSLAAQRAEGEGPSNHGQAVSGPHS